MIRMMSDKGRMAKMARNMGAMKGAHK
jgi:hypothetical protein